MTQTDRPILALLIDADNISASLASDIVSETHKLGNPYLRKVYADWSRQNSSAWRDVVAKEGFEPVQVTQIASQKNGADIRLAIDAMDLLHSNTFGGFVIVSSDSDFSSLALRIRQQGIRVFGIGEERALDGYQRAFTKFVVVGEPAATNVAPACANPIDRLLAKAFAELSPDLSVAPLNQIGQAIRKIEPDYAHQSFGGKTLSSVIALSDNFKVIEGNRVQRK